MSVLALGVISVGGLSHAAQNQIFSNSGLKIPRFVSLSNNETNVRAGPGQKYPVKWVINRKFLPVEVILEFDHWRKIKDQEGAEGWVFHSLLSGKRTAIILGDNTVSAYEDTFEGDHEKPHVSMHLEPMSMVEIVSCEGAWCAITTSGLSGWIKRKSLWGVYETENID